MTEDPFFLTRTQVDEAHRVSLQRYGGIAGVRDESGVKSALVFLEGNGVPTDNVDSFTLHEALITVAERRMGKVELAGRFRILFGGDPGTSR